MIFEYTSSSFQTFKSVDRFTILNKKNSGVERFGNETNYRFN